MDKKQVALLQCALCSPDRPWPIRKLSAPLQRGANNRSCVHIDRAVSELVWFPVCQKEKQNDTELRSAVPHGLVREKKKDEHALALGVSLVASYLYSLPADLHILFHSTFNLPSSPPAHCAPPFCISPTHIVPCALLQVTRALPPTPTENPGVSDLRSRILTIIIVSSVLPPCRQRQQKWWLHRTGVQTFLVGFLVLFLPPFLFFNAP